MLSGDFLRVLRTLNPKLRVCSLGENGKMAGIYYVNEFGYQDVCAIDKNDVPEFPAFDEAGHMVKAGWRRAVFILLQNRLTTIHRVRRLWPGFFMRRAPDISTGLGDPVENEMRRYLSDDGVLSTDEILDVAEDLRRKDSCKVQEEREHDRWFLKKWQKNGGNASDKPVY